MDIAQRFAREPAAETIKVDAFVMLDSILAEAGIGVPVETVWAKQYAEVFDFLACV